MGNAGSIRTTHVGSLPRGKEMDALLWERQEGKDVMDAFTAALPDAVARLVDAQADAGISIVGDGEVSKPGFTNYVRHRIGGMGGETHLPHFLDLAEAAELEGRYYGGEADEHVKMPQCVAELHYTGHEEVRRDVANLKAAMERRGIADGFLCSASPGVIAYEAEDTFYGSYEDYLGALAEALREEYEAIAEAGLTVQLDSPDLACVGHSRFWASDVVDRMGYRAYAELHIDAINHATRNIPAEQVRMHLCWGNYAASHHMDMPLAQAMPPLLERFRGQGILFEGANPRHEHEWELFEQLSVPDDKVLIPGVIDTLSPYVEHPRLIAQRLQRYARLVGPERVIGGTDCGFATFVGFKDVPDYVVWMKLAALAQGAAMASESAGVGSAA
jgi:5-methyltetrahydropteroyltriglutamate--homocysteine methyltransferase